MTWKCDIRGCPNRMYEQGLCANHYHKQGDNEPTLTQQIADLRAENRRLREELGI